VLRAVAGALLVVAVPAVAQAAEVSHVLHIVDGVAAPDERLIEAHKGDRVRLHIVSNRPGEMHLHAYRLSVRLKPDEHAELAFDAFATGRFRLEWHPANAQGAPVEAHDAAPLATLEVRPT
jgi:hypothetical protein